MKHLGFTLIFILGTSVLLRDVLDYEQFFLLNGFVVLQSFESNIGLLHCTDQ